MWVMIAAQDHTSSGKCLAQLADLRESVLNETAYVVEIDRRLPRLDLMERSRQLTV